MKNYQFIVKNVAKLILSNFRIYEEIKTLIREFIYLIFFKKNVKMIFPSK